MSSDQIVRNDPVLKEAMRKHGLQWSDFVEREDQSFYLARTSATSPHIEIDTEQVQWSMSVSWRVSGKEIRYDLDGEGGIITVKDTQLPATTLAGLSGKPASTLMDMPGFDMVVIDQAVLSSAFAGDPLDLRMSVLNIDLAKEHVA
tara:strand:+ start:1269 stop:1706 length:438 start_codon:yes stop_codon:yes gene_type:complete